VTVEAAADWPPIPEPEEPAPEALESDVEELEAEEPAAPLPASVVDAPAEDLPVRGGVLLDALAGLLRRWKARGGGDDADLLEEQRREEMRSQLESEAWFYMERMLAVSKRMDYLCYRYKRSEKDMFNSGVSTIAFSDVVLQPEAIYLRVDTLRLPRNVSVNALKEEETLFNMSMACRHKVLAEHEEGKGFWYIIERSSGTRGIPIHVRLDEMWSMRGPTHDGLAIPFGIGENKKPVWRSLSQMVSLLVAGAPGSGKSNMLNVALCTWIRFNAPHRLKLALVDMKGGMEFGPYAEVPHLMRYRPLPHKKDEPLEPPDDESAPAEQEASLIAGSDADQSDEDDMLPALVERREDVLPLLRAIYKEGRRRIRLLRQAGERSVGNYNWKHPKRSLPHLVVMIDELAELRMLTPAEYEKVMKLLTSIAQLFRAVGVHIVPATQTVVKQVISLSVRNAIPGRLAFGCPSVIASSLVIGNGAAAGLSPAGRAILDYNGKQTMLQTPLIPDRLVEKVIEGAIRGEYEEYELKRHDVTEADVFRVALEEFGGKLPPDELYRWFNNKGRHIPRQEVREIVTRYLGQEVPLGGSIYRVVQGKGGRPPYLETTEEQKS